VAKTIFRYHDVRKNIENYAILAGVAEWVQGTSFAVFLNRINVLNACCWCQTYTVRKHPIKMHITNFYAHLGKIWWGPPIGWTPLARKVVGRGSPRSGGNQNLWCPRTLTFRRNLPEVFSTTDDIHDIHASIIIAPLTI